MKKAENELSIVIPVYNSETMIHALYERLTQELESLTGGYEIIFVNDCSTDNSWRVLSRLADRDTHVTAICLRKNAGYDNALMAGLKYSAGSYVVIMDDDLQHAPEDIPLLLNEIKKGYDVVYAKFEKKQQTLVKNIGSWLNGKLAQMIIDKPPDIYLSPFKILRGEVVREIISYQGPYPYIDGLIFQVTSSLHQIPLTHHKRHEGQGNHGFFRSFGIVFNFCTTFSILPLRIATVAGFIIFLIACISCIWLIIWKLWLGIEEAGWPSLIFMIILLGGLQLMTIGILGEYLGRTYMNINKRPQYVIKESRNINPKSQSIT